MILWWFDDCLVQLLRMAVHSARQCLLQKKSGFLCKKRDCLARQAVLERLYKSCARGLSNILTNRNVKYKPLKRCQTPNEDSDLDVPTRGRPTKARKKGRLQFVGNVNHDVSILKSRRITGSERQNLMHEFSCSRTKPSTFYRSKLRDLDEDSYASGNRLGCGVTSKAFQHISTEAKRKQNNVNLISEKIRDCDKAIQGKGGGTFETMMDKQQILGFVQSNDITNDTLCVVLFDEGCVRLYRHVCSKDILFFDATGTIVEAVKGFKKLLLYSLTTRNPFNKSPPVPVAELISSSHTAGSIQRLFSLLREKERAVYGDNIQPFAIRTDFSLAIINACIAEFNGGMTVGTYIDHCYDIVSGQTQSFQDSHMTLVLVCAAHVMKMNSNNVERRAFKRVASENRASVKHLAMRIVGLLVNIDRLDDAIEIVKLAYIAFMSECITPTLTEALERLSAIVNEFKVARRETDGERLPNDNDNDDHDHDDEEEEPFPMSKSRNKFKVSME